MVSQLAWLWHFDCQAGRTDSAGQEQNKSLGPIRGAGKNLHVLSLIGPLPAVRSWVVVL